MEPVQGSEMLEMLSFKMKKNSTAERKLKQGRKEKRERSGRINSIFAVHRVSLTLPVDPGPVHMSAHLCAYVSTITW